MTCDEIRDLLPLHLYGDVNDAERAAVEAHLATCGECRAELAALAAVEYRGWLVVEREEGDRRLADVAEGVKFLRRLVA